MSSQGADGLYATTKELISEHAFKIVLWVGVGLCTTICLLRFTIRLICFRRLLLEDYLILASTAIFIGVAAALQRFLGDIYMMIHVQNGLEIPGADFEDRMLSGLRMDGAVLILNTVGVWLVKLNFLVFFHRLGHQIKSYLIFWWIALVIVVGCGAVLLGVIPYKCSFGSFSTIVLECSTNSYLNHIYTMYKASISIDVVSDAIIICFPVTIVWKTKMKLRQKLLLTSVFLLVAFNIAVTVVRGSVFGGVYKEVQENDRQVLDTSWSLFWYYMEYMMSLIISSIISFRSLWVGRKDKVKTDQMKYERQKQIKAHPKTRTPPEVSSWHRFKLNLLDTLTTLEGTTIDEDESSFLRLRFPSGRMTVDFSNWGRPTSAHAPKTSSADSDQSMSNTEVSRSVAPEDW